MFNMQTENSPAVYFYRNIIWAPAPLSVFEQVL